MRYMRGVHATVNPAIPNQARGSLTHNQATQSHGLPAMVSLEMGTWYVQWYCIAKK